MNTVARFIRFRLLQGLLLNILVSPLTLLSLWPQQLAGQNQPLWTHAEPGAIDFYEVTPLGNIVLVTAGNLVGLDPGTGQPSWTYTHGQAKTYVSIAETPYGLFDYGDHVDVIDLTKGTKLWGTADVGISDLKGYLPYAERDLLLLYAGSTPDSSVLLAVGLGSGRVLWRHQRPFAAAPKIHRALVEQEKTANLLHGGQTPVLVTDTTFLLYVSEDGPVLVHAGTGAFLWRADVLKGERPPALRDLYPEVLVRDSVAFIPFGKKLHAIRLRDGTAVWAKPAEFPSRVIQLESDSWGVLVRGARREYDAKRDDPFVQLVDPATGAQIWRWKKGSGIMNGAEPPPNTSPFVRRGNRAYFAWDGDVYTITLDKGAVTKLGKVRFKGGEQPAIVENRPDGILLWSAQNLLLVDTSGAVLYQANYPAPPIGFLGHLATVALRVALDVASYSLAESQARRTGVPQTYEQYDNPFLRIRYAAAADAAAYAYILTSQEDTDGQRRSLLVRVQKDRNSVEGRVWLSEKRPPFEVDPFTATVYVQTAPQQIAAFKF